MAIGLFPSTQLGDRAGDRRPGRDRARFPFAAGLGAWLTLLCLLVATLLPTPARAQLATGGVGAYRENIVWFSWGTTNDEIVPQSGLTLTNTTIVSGLFLNTTCTLSNISSPDPDPDLVVLIPSLFGGNQLDTMYNIGGTDAANTMAIGVANRSVAFGGLPSGQHFVDFTLACSATFGPTNSAADPPFALDGLVMADAEGSTSTEYIQVTMSNAGQARVIETYSPPGCTKSNRATRVVVGANQQLRVTGGPGWCDTTGADQNPAAIMFMDGVTTGDFQIRGDGRSAIAVGVFVTVSDQGDAPASYGNPQHLTQFTWSGGTIPATADHDLPNGTNINFPAEFTPAVQNAASTTRFGATVDVEIADLSNAAATGDDADGLDDEDGIVPPGPIVLPSSGAFTQTATCAGDGRAVRGFIDWNRDGDFDDAGEASVPTICAGGSTTVVWTAPPVSLQGPSYMRLRIAANGNAGEIASPTGIAGAGEVEDYAVTLIPSQITLVKQLNGRATAVDQFTVSIQNTPPVSVTTTGSGVNGTSTVSTAITPVDAGTPLVLRDALTAGTGALATYTKSITCVANAGSTGAVPVPTGPVEAGNTADWTITPNLGNDLTCTITNAAPEPTFTIVKALTGESGTVAGVAEPGEQLTYTITATNTSGVDAVGVLIADAIPANTTFVSASNGGAVVGSEVQWTQDIAANSPISLTVVFQVVTPIPAGVTEIANSATVDDPTDTNPPTSCATVPCVRTPTAEPTFTIVKALTGESGTVAGVAEPGEQLTYTITATNTSGVDAVGVLIADAIPANTTFVSASNGGAVVGSEVQWTQDIAANSPISLTVVFQVVTPIPAGVTEIANSATVDDPTDTNPPTSCATVPCVRTPTAEPTFTIVKALTGENGTQANAAEPGEQLTYTITATNTSGVDAVGVLIADAIPANTTFVSASNGGAVVGSEVQWTQDIAANSPISLTVVFQVVTPIPAGVTEIANSATVDDPSDTNPPTSCATVPCVRTPVAPTVTYSKSADTAGPVAVGDTITYTLSMTVTNAPTTAVVTLTDTLGPGLDFGAVTSAGAFTCNAVNPLVCTLPAGTAPGTYTVSYTATVNAQATGTVDNAVLGTGTNTPTCAANCSTATPVVLPVITVAKSSDPAPGTQVQFGQTITYTLTVTVTNAATLAELVLVDTPDPGLTIGVLPSGCAMTGATITCTVPAGSPVGVYTFVYAGTVNAQAGASVSNLVTATVSSGQPPICDTCSITHQLMAPEIRLTKTAGVREVKLGDLVRYTLTVENVGDTDLINGSLVDTPPAGFSFVEGSLLVVDGDNAATVFGQSPLRFNGLDVAIGQTATLTYLMQVGAGVRPGVHQNQAQVFGPDGTPISNVATAEVQLAADPLLDDSLIFGTVFDDRDGDGWQDRADLRDVRVQGGFAPEAYLAGSTTLDRGTGPQSELDASAPLLHGIDVGAISARQSDADPVADHQVIVRQRLNALTFTNDFVLTNAEGVTVKMDAAGTTTIEKHGEADKGLNAAAPTVERRVAQGEGGYVVDYVIRNAGVDERGIPGVRIASVEGLLIETDQYGRYHLAGTSGGPWERGRHFILKVDPSTLPAGAPFTTDNPLLRRITPGLPVRFDWGVKLPVTLIAGTELVEMVLGTVCFEPGSADVKPQYQPVIEKIAAKVREHHGGEVVIDANGDTEGLAFDRAMAVKQALLAVLDAESAKGLVISARGHVDDPSSLVVGVDEGGALFGTVLFDTDKSAIRSEFGPLLDKVAAALDRMGGGSIAIVGHTDVRASYEYNVALGMRRAKAVYEALAKRLSPAVRAKVRVETSDDPTAPVGAGRKQGEQGS